MTKTTLPPASKIEETIDENKSCPVHVKSSPCGKRRVSCDVEFFEKQWVVFFTCEDDHRWYAPIVKPDDSRTNVGP